MPQQDSMGPAVDSGAFNLTVFNNNSSSSCESDDLSNSDSDTSCHNELSSSKSSSTFHTTASRRYQCEELIRPKKTRCHKEFKRSEHLRRHIRTAHCVDYFPNYECKIPSCSKKFKRRDNLRPHYLTHLIRTKIADPRKNKVVTFQELEKILGSEEEDLLKSLKAKLGKT
ncbi:hypothetical protein COCCADRAFT_10608 [Bipolaris zeicola 26-R-13]|uniref:C2H2-type domain-containing protein n=1 Tax=Cochliobolus carbonum (strain 26-R-13) TaxID=930089 RepID=W6XHS4_COCC2|nr:uncharacterized protein COCCADRAFT_10608 [Bipolaris zeicola 26-R-13]EUC26622.1 hypothetical protein COCCADRAFT_10608 [Bipolaris zeicola 26-R-13]